VTTRSVDWRVVWTSSDDPIPGYPDTVARGGAEYQSNGRAIRNAIDYLDRLSLEEIKSDSVAKLADQMRTVRAELDRVEERVNGAGNALVDYAEKFRGYQKQTMTLWEEADALQSQLDSTNGDLAALKRHADRLGDSDEDEKKRVGEQMAAASDDAKRIASALAPLRRQFSDAVSAQRTSAEILRGTLQAIDDTTPGKDSFWDKVQSWVNQVVTAVFEAVMNLIKAAVELLIEALKILVLALIAVIVIVAVLIIAAVAVVAVAALLVLLVHAAVAFSALELLRHPDLMMQVLLTVAAGGAIYMLIAGAKRATRQTFTDCDLPAERLSHDQKLLACAEASYQTGSAETAKLPTGYSVLSDAEMAHLGLTEGMLEDPESGFRASVYKDPDGHLIVAFAGTDDAVDWVNDASGGLGTTKQDLMAMNIARKLATGPEASNVTYTGHSLGGRLASVAAIASGAPAVTFNPAGVSDAAVSMALAKRDGSNVYDAARHLAEAGQNVTVYKTEGDILNNVQEGSEKSVHLAPPAFGDHLYVVHDPTGGDPGDQHSIESLKPAMDYEVTEASRAMSSGS
jgi:hypothetical protein